MKRLSLVFIIFSLVFGLFANPLEKVTSGEWEFVSEEGPKSTWVKDGVTMEYFGQKDYHYVSLIDDEMIIYFEGDFKETKAANFELLHNRIPNVEWKEAKKATEEKHKLVKKTIAKADAEDTATGKREGVHTAASRASEAKDDFEWEEE